MADVAAWRPAPRDRSCRQRTSSRIPSAALYDTATLRTVFLQFENADWEQELEAFHNTDVEVPATAIVDGKTYKNVGVHFRGASSYMMVPEGSKRSLNVSFDFIEDKQRLDSYRTLNLLNANGDPTFVRTVVYSDIARQYIPGAACQLHARRHQRRELGYLRQHPAVQQRLHARLLQERRRARAGRCQAAPAVAAAWSTSEMTRRRTSGTYEIKTKDDSKSWADLIQLFRVLNETPADKLEAALAPILDIDGALKFLALDVALVNSDGYWTRASDYSIYQDEKGRFHVIPHDMNEGLADEGGRGFGPPPVRTRRHRGTWCPGGQAGAA